MTLRSTYRPVFCALLLLSLYDCNKSPKITPNMLDSGKVFDPSLYNPKDYLLSEMKPNPTDVEKETPVIIAAHGYSATTFEWKEFRDWIKNRNSNIGISQVLLAGHGRSYEDFRKSTWKDWYQPILAEYNKLLNLGYKNICFALSSASGALVLQMIHSGKFSDKTPPKEIFLIDPIVVPSDKNLYLVGFIGPMLGYIDTEQPQSEDPYWYHFRPEETLRQLNDLLTQVRASLEDGIRLPSGTRLKVYKSLKDPTADPVSAVLIYKGCKSFDGSPVDVKMINSSLHVFTRLSLRENLSDKDFRNQKEVFEDIELRALDMKRIGSFSWGR